MSTAFLTFVNDDERLETNFPAEDVSFDEFGRLIHRPTEREIARYEDDCGWRTSLEQETPETLWRSVRFEVA